MHAVVALLSVHKIKALMCTSVAGQKGISMEEQFLLKQYSKAISSLQPHFSAKSNASVRVALITCVLFVCIELTLGHYRTGNTHLRHGLKLLGYLQANSRLSSEQEVFVLGPFPQTLDEWITETFMRLLFHAGPFRQCPELFQHIVPPETAIDLFKAMSQARQCLDRLFMRIFGLVEECRQEWLACGVVTSLGLFDRQRRLKGDLDVWLRNYEVYDKTRIQLASLRERIEYQLLLSYHTMASIMTQTALWPGCEMRYDAQSADFALLIEQTINVVRTLWSTGSVEMRHGDEDRGEEMRESFPDLGWVPPLYYTIVKCRDHRLRSQALKLLNDNSHKETMWDAKLAASVCQAVMDVEEQDFYSGMIEADENPMSSMPAEECVAILPVLPHTHRMHEVQVVLPNDTTEGTKLFCKRREDDGRWYILECVLSPRTRSPSVWIEKIGVPTGVDSAPRESLGETDSRTENLPNGQDGQKRYAVAGVYRGV
ncbi:hypothetical protein BDV96DRAFT_650907 [Lophiotrema nucula]|uniref:Uncharacterized protein n=1 Tax=Lophiotrema nucula TaxID=690887 RepID=A0A6A5YST1_9PLEO|nr:hypothetical protein BDV96DRAFT_650907 [Lophiotrema nucula]